MKRLALISDIHGNGVALDAVLAELTRWRVDEIICLGDVAVGGPQPQAVIARLRELDCRSVRGNAEGWLLDGLPPGRSEETRRLGEIVAWTRAALGRDDLEYLAGLPPTLTVRADAVTLFCFHGSPRSEIEALLATTPARELEEALACAPAARLLAGGHTHLQLSRQCGDRLLVNPGSIGLPLGSLTEAEARLPAWAEYALVEMDGGDVRIFLKRVAVKVETLAAATSALAAFPVGRWLDRHSPRPLMTLGSLAGALLVLAWSQVHDLLLFYSIWIGIGLAMACVLYEPAFIVVTKWFRERRRQALTAVTLVGGFASFVFSPLSNWLIDLQGWRQALITLALILAAVTVPLHALFLRAAPEQVERKVAANVPARAALGSSAFWYLTAAFVVSSFAISA